MTLADELAELAGLAAGCKSEMDHLAATLVNTHDEERRSRIRRDQGKLMGTCLSYRLAFLYKLEEHWPQVLSALREQIPQLHEGKKNG